MDSTTKQPRIRRVPTADDLGIKPRSARGGGSITERKDGQPGYRGYVDLGKDPITGKRRRKSVTGPTRQAVAEKMNALRVGTVTGTTVLPTSVTLTVADMLDRHAARLDLRLKAGKITTATRETWAYADKRVRADLGTVPLTALDHRVVEEWVAGLSRSGSSNHKDFVLLKAAATTVKRDGLMPLTWDPFVGVDGPSAATETDPQDKMPTEAQVDHILEKALEPVSKYRPGTRDHRVAVRLWALWTVLAGTGMRRGEALGLTWGDVDLEARMLRVRRATTKTAAGARTVPIVRDVHAALETLRATPGIDAAPDAAVFPIETRHLARSFAAVRPRKSGLTPHSLRHRAATRMLEAGAPVHVVAEVLGHADPAVTLRTYAHAVEGGKRAALEALTRL